MFLGSMMCTVLGSATMSTVLVSMTIVLDDLMYGFLVLYHFVLISRHVVEVTISQCRETSVCVRWC